jgi:predicted molibdopterin-dependent oxidoreductase YjgC
MIHFTPVAGAAETDTVRIDVDGVIHRVDRGISVAAALLEVGCSTVRTHPVSHARRAPYCMMGVCFECLVTTGDGTQQRACMLQVADGLRVSTR